MATVEFRYDPKNTAWFTANAAMVLKVGEPAYHDTTGLFKLGDGVTALSALSFLPTVSASTPTIQQVLTAGQVATTTIETTGFIKTGGLSTQFLKADGTIDSNVYGVGNALTSNPLSQFAATTSSQLAGVISDETGSGALVFGTSPTFTTSIFSPLVNGASTASGTLTLASTSNATKGKILFGTSAYDEVNNRLGIGTASPGVTLDIIGTGSISNLLTCGQINAYTGNLGLYAKNANNSIFFGTNIGANVLAQWNGISTSGAVTTFTFTTPAHTNQTTTTNIPNFRISGANKQWATGTVANQYWNYLTANTAAFVGASTMTNSYGLFVEAATAGTNATITNNYAAGFGGRVNILSDTATIMIGSQVGSTARGAIYINQATPSTTNFALSAHQTTGQTYINGLTGVAFLFSGTIQWINSDKLTTFGSGLTNYDFNFGSTNGTKLGTATTQKISFWNATPIVQPTTAVAAATVVSGAGGTVKHDDTFDGYTVEKVVRALRNIGLLA